jgi:cell division protein FtsB
VSNKTVSNKTVSNKSTSTRTASAGSANGASRHATRDRSSGRGTRPASVRLSDRRRIRLALGALASVIVVAIVAALVVLPVRTWLAQRDELQSKNDELVTLQRANDGLRDDIESLQTPEGIEDAARVELGYQKAGETRVAVNERPTAPVDLPAGWPYSTVEDILAVRRAGG